IDVRSVKVGERVDDDLWIITEGLKPGEKVVAEGVQKVKQGMTVKPTPYTSQRKTTTGVPAKPEAKPNAPTKANGRQETMSKCFITRPIAAIVISILLTIVGSVAMAQLPTALFPNIAPPEIQLQTTYVGADALTLEQSVAAPVEEQMTGVAKMIYMYSLSASSGGQMTLRVD